MKCRQKSHGGIAIGILRFIRVLNWLFAKLIFSLYLSTVGRFGFCTSAHCAICKLHRQINEKLLTNLNSNCMPSFPSHVRTQHRRAHNIDACTTNSRTHKSILMFGTYTIAECRIKWVPSRRTTKFLFLVICNLQEDTSNQ